MAGTRWVRLDVQYHTNPKITALVNAHPKAVLLHLAMCAYCGQELTDGFVPDRAGSQLGPRAGLQRLHAIRANIRLLAEVGLVDLVPGGCMVHDFLVMNPQASRAAVEAERDRWRSAKRDQRQAMSNEDNLSEANDVPAPTRHDTLYLHPQDDVTGLPSTGGGRE